MKKHKTKHKRLKTNNKRIWTQRARSWCLGVRSQISTSLGSQVADSTKGAGLEDSKTSVQRKTCQDDKRQWRQAKFRAKKWRFPPYPRDSWIHAATTLWCHLNSFVAACQLCRRSLLSHWIVLVSCAKAGAPILAGLIDLVGSEDGKDDSSAKKGSCQMILMIRLEMSLSWRLSQLCDVPTEK